GPTGCVGNMAVAAMSGQLVGEVLDAREAGRLDDLSPDAVLVLLVIAEKCHHVTRQGSVRMSRIQAAMGRRSEKSQSAAASRGAAARILRRLKDRGFVRVVKRGYKSHGDGHANVYEVAVLVPPKTAHAPV